MMGLNMNFLRQAQELQERIKKLQDELVNKYATGSSGGDMVKATVNGKHEVIEIKISKEIIDPKDMEMLEDLVVAAVNDGMHKIDETIKTEMAKVTGGLNIPGLEVPF
ncbi:MAG: YbaB/EbfC family nucleoid-associated protein [Spirochaetota bacterium]|nr:MAG: YbaB/EbfC family nucleoid-associated protein [Spirochaetota bacterium]